MGEIRNITNLDATAALNAKINEVKGKMTNSINLDSTSPLAAVAKIPNISNFVK